MMAMREKKKKRKINKGHVRTVLRRDAEVRSVPNVAPMDPYGEIYGHAATVI